MFTPMCIDEGSVKGCDYPTSLPKSALKVLAVHSTPMSSDEGRVKGKNNSPSLSKSSFVTKSMPIAENKGDRKEQDHSLSYSISVNILALPRMTLIYGYLTWIYTKGIHSRVHSMDDGIIYAMLRPRGKYLGGSQPNLAEGRVFCAVPHHFPFIQLLHTAIRHWVATSNINVHKLQ